MTMRRILQCVLVLLALTMAGCSYFDSSNPTSNSPNNNSKGQTAENADRSTTSQRPAAPPNWKSASEKLQSALNKVSSDRSPAYTAKRINDDLEAALSELGNDSEEIRIKCRNCEDTAIVAAQEAGRSMTTAIKMLQSLQNNPLNAAAKAKVTPLLEGARQDLQTAINGATAPVVLAASPTPTASPSSSKIDESNATKSYTFWERVILGLVVAGCLLVLVLIGMGLLHLRNQSWQHLETHLAKATAAQMSATREAQKEILDRLSSISSAEKDTSSRLHDVHTEIRSLARLVRESSHIRGDGHSYASLASSYAQSDPLPKDEPDFPVSAFDYLGKMTRFANVVKPDFQNGILINDPDGTGELVLIRDSRQPDESQPLFVVPRHAQFQTKQDFHTYYEKYYDCTRPQAGDVWIIDPAVVEKVSGGWQLREKGLLEIR